MTNSKKKASSFSVAVWGASAFFFGGASVAGAMPASLDGHIALFSNNFTWKNESGEISSYISQAPADFEHYTKALAGNKHAQHLLLKKMKTTVSLKGVPVQVSQSGKNLRLRAGKCHYKLRLITLQATSQGLVSTYKALEKLPRNCNAQMPVAATEQVQLKARLINSAKGVFQLPLQPDGSAVSAVLNVLAPVNGGDAGLFGYTYFLKYANGTTLNWNSAGVMSNKLALGKSNAIGNYLIAEAIGQGAMRLSQAGVMLGSPSLQAPTLKSSAEAPCDYQLYLDRASLSHKADSLRANFLAPKLSPRCAKGKNPVFVSMTVEPLNIDLDGTNRMIVEKLEREKKSS